MPLPAYEEEKISKFLDAIHADALSRRESIAQETEAFKKAELEQAEQQALSEAYMLIHKEIDAARATLARELANREIASKRELLAHRAGLAGRIFDTCRQQVAQFTGSTGYLPFLQKSVKEIAARFDSGEVILYLREADIKFAPKVVKAFGRPVGVETTGDIVLGGVIAFNQTTRLRADHSLDSKLEAQRAWFVQHSGFNMN